MARVAVIAGGRSSEREVSLLSGAAVTEGLRDAGHVAEMVTVDGEGRWTLAGIPVHLSPGEGIEGFDVAFPVVHGPWGEDGTLQGLLESLRIPYVGSGVFASALCLDKVLAKERLAEAGVAQVGFMLIEPGSWETARPEIESRVASLGSPVWVKPARLGSSVGISRVDRSDDLVAAVDLALDHDPRVIVEASSPGREIEVSVMEKVGGTGVLEVVVSPPGEITLPGAGEGDWYDYSRKYEAGGMELIAPADLDSATRSLVTETARRAFAATLCEGYARVDCFVEPGRVLVNEINTSPGFTRTSVFARLFEAAGVDFAQVLDSLVAVALERDRLRARHSF